MKIKELKIKNFRSIKELNINEITNAMIFVGKNNVGKSAIINAIRLLAGDYQVKPEDFHKDSGEIEVKGIIYFEEDDFKNFIFDNKIGILKIPSNANDFNHVKAGTNFQEDSFNDFKTKREELISGKSFEEIQSDEECREVYNIWLKAIKDKFKIIENEITIICKVNKNNMESNYYDADLNNISDLKKFLPRIAFIDDDRNFEEEGNGKAKTLTNELFSKFILNINRANEEISCDSCVLDNCKRCIDEIHRKNIQELSLRDLEKLIKNKMDINSRGVSETINRFFQNNYSQQNFKIIIDPTSNLEKSLSIKTKIIDSNLGKKLDLSNVGAGVRSIYILSLLQAYQEMNSNDNVIFLLEEPEIYLHPSLQKLMGAILHCLWQNKSAEFGKIKVQS
ncbi:AAA family ATPase [Carboxydothermus ferrireducens]|uniref:ATP-dependent endonuclease of OLD family n=1 Tax=Carboxydothermus ferrireducens DSM 11255 TaxID=1119529 RepID=A0ABX2R983_9THEO|nr:AAA family ATPase [Carboxydothermus ferrireducens]NYE57739.1 putative ATP-dependent endonuclease of OLD family [Carboxydothermus ferrireducens DSM 11255]